MVEQIITDKAVVRRDLWQAIDVKADEDFLQSPRECIKRNLSLQHRSSAALLIPRLSGLNINLTMLVDEERHDAVFLIRVELLEGAYVCRNHALWLTPVWKSDGLGTCSLSDLKEFAREALRDYVDRFINDYLAANPKDRLSEETQ